MPVFLLFSIATLAGLICYQDFKERKVAVWLLAGFSVLVVTETYLLQSAGYAIKSALLNILFLFIQFVLVAGYYLFRYRNFGKLQRSVGAADLWLLLALAACFSPLNFVVFITFSLLISLVGFLAFSLLIRPKLKEIPLAGAVALIYGAGRVIAHFYFPGAAWNDELLMNAFA